MLLLLLPSILLWSSLSTTNGVLSNMASFFNVVQVLVQVQYWYVPVVCWGREPTYQSRVQSRMESTGAQSIQSGCTLWDRGATVTLRPRMNWVAWPATLLKRF